MSSSIKIAVVGNCQARPLSAALTNLAPAVTISGTVIVHLVNDAQIEEYAPILAGSDLIFAQRVADNYPCAFVRTDNLKRQYGSKVVSWPNLYFSGYNPELFYLKDPDRRNTNGPLGEYHVREVRDTWCQGKSVSEAVNSMTDLAFQEQQYSGVPDESIRDLAAREKDTDVKISEWVSQRRWDRQLFLTFNHPSNHALYKTARLLLNFAGVSMSETYATGGLKEPLGKILCPINPYIRAKYGLHLSQQDSYRGQQVTFSESGYRVATAVQSYGVTDLVEIFFRLYNTKPIF